MNTLSHRRHHHRHQPGQRGAAMVEFVVIALFVLVPLYLAVQALGKLADVSSAAHTASRYAAWEKTVWHEDTSSTFSTINAPNQKSAAAIRNEMMVRILNDRRSGLKYSSNDKTATTLANGTDPLWRDTAGAALVDDPSKVTASAGYQTPSKDILGGAISLISSVAGSIPGAGTLVPPVPTNTMAVADVKLAEVGAKSEVYKRLWAKSAGLPDDWAGLDFTSSGAILSNSWAANSSQGTRAMVASSVPTANGLGTILNGAAVGMLAGWDLTQAPRLDIGRIAQDVVPDDRLK